MKRTSWTAAFTFLANLGGVISLIKDIVNTKKIDMTESNIYTIVSILATFAIVYYFLGQIFSIRNELKLHSIVSKVRDVVIFEKQYENIEFYMLPDESLEGFLNRSKPGIYSKKYLEEIRTVRELAINEFPNKSIRQIDRMIVDLYGLLKGKNKKNVTLG